jgi:hypothetical protein
MRRVAMMSYHQPWGRADRMVEVWKAEDGRTYLDAVLVVAVRHSGHFTCLILDGGTQTYVLARDFLQATGQPSDVLASAPQRPQTET